MSVSQLHPELTSFHESMASSANAAADQPSLKRRLVIGDAIAAFACFAIPLSTPGSSLAHLAAHPTPTGIAQAVWCLAVAVAATLGALATQRLYLSRVAAMRTVEIARIGRISLFLGVAALVAGKLIN